MAYQTQHLFELAVPTDLLFFVGAGTVCSYNFHWALASPGVDQKISPKNAWSLRNRRLHLALSLISLVIALLFFYRLREHFIWLAIAVVVTFLYSAPKIPFHQTAWLRHVAYGKTIFLALAWTYITTLLPLLIDAATLETEHFLYCTNRFFLIYAICILFDLRDREQDRQEGIRSLVTLLDQPGINHLYRGVMVIFFMTTVWLVFYFSLAVIAALCIPALVVAVFYKWFRTRQSDVVYYFVLDGLMAFSLPLLLIFEF